MSGQFFVIRDEHTLKQAQQWLAQLRGNYTWFRLNLQLQKRSLNANALSHIWYAEIAKQTGDSTEDEIKNICKLHFGVPILRRESEEFRNFYDRFFKKLTYPEKLDAMKHISVTSLLDKNQMTEYMQQIQRTYGPKGVILSNSKEAAGI